MLMSPLFQVWYNQKAFHALPSYLNHLNNLILWRHLPHTVDWRRHGEATSDALSSTTGNGQRV